MLTGCATTAPVGGAHRQAFYNLLGGIKGESSANRVTPPQLDYATANPYRTQANHHGQQHQPVEPQPKKSPIEVRPVPPVGESNHVKAVSSPSPLPTQATRTLQPEVVNAPPPHQRGQKSQQQTQPQPIPYYDSVLPPSAALPMPNTGSYCDPTLPCVPSQQQHHLPQPCNPQPCVPQPCDPQPCVPQTQNTAQQPSKEPSLADARRSQQIDNLLTRVTALEQDLRTSKKTTKELRHELTLANRQVVDLSNQVRQWQGRVHELELTMQEQHQRDIKALDRITRLLGSLVEMEGGDQMVGARR